MDDASRVISHSWTVSFREAQVGGRGATTAASGRPVDVLQLTDGSVLISDDRGDRLIRVSYRP